MSRDLPNLGLKGGYLEGDDGWGDEQNANLLKLSTLVQGGVSEILAAVPGVPTPGLVVILDETNVGNPNAVAVWDGAVGEEEWTYLDPLPGWLLWDNAQEKYVTFDGTAWAVLETGGGGGGGVEEAPEDGFTYGRKDAAWVVMPGGGVPTMVPFTGTGVEQEVELPVFPAALAVFVGGLFNYPDVDYTVDGNTITITTNEADSPGMALVWNGGELPPPSAARWRVYVSTNDGGVLTSISELFLYTDGAPTDVATTGTPTQSSQYDAFAPANFLDRNTATFASLQLSGAGLPGWFEVEFAAPETIVGFGITGRISELNNSPKDMILQYFDEDAVAWVDLITPPSQTAWGASTRDFFV